MKGRFDSVSRYDEPPPYRFVSLAEQRVGGFVVAFNHQQTYSGALGARQTTLLDLVVSAYLQGVNDCVEALPRREPTECDRPCCVLRQVAEEADRG